MRGGGRPSHGKGGGDVRVFWYDSGAQEGTPIVLAILCWWSGPIRPGGGGGGEGAVNKVLYWETPP